MLFFLQAQSPQANLGVLDQHPRDRRCVGPTCGGKAREQHLLLDPKVKLALAPPELEERGLGLAGALTASSAQTLGNDERLMVIAGEGPKGWVALHCAHAAARTVRTRSFWVLPRGSSTSTSSPGKCPIRARPIGELAEAASASPDSKSPTSRCLRMALEERSSTSTTVPTEAASLLAGSCSTTLAESSNR
jgi:hypothetical protein